MQTTGDLVGVGIEFAPRMQLGHDDLCRGAPFRIIAMHLGRYAPAVVSHTDRIVRMNRDDDFIAMPTESLIDGVVEHFEYHVMQARTIGGVADVHAGALAYRIQPLQYLDAVRIVGISPDLLVVFGFNHFCSDSNSHRHDNVLEIVPSRNGDYCARVRIT